MMKKIACAAALLVASTSVASAEEDLIPGSFSANVALTSDYTFRGISQILEEPAIQGGFEWSVDAAGVTPYIGTWASNVDFGVDETLEMDVYGGVRGEFASIGLDAGLIYYMYPGSGPDYDFLELKLGASYSPHEMVTVGATYFFSPEFFAETGQAHYINGTVSVAPGLPLDITFFGGIGYQWIEDNARWGTPDYSDWTIGVSATVEMLTFKAAYVDTSLDENECFGGTDLCGARFVGSVSASF